ncbi:hypothetical protein H1C71_039001 [Ictidomys tridecemlineatus]|nr:hypothetical protein H1C71_039001 [Ictidomys tridecemlineatus]
MWKEKKKRGFCHVRKNPNNQATDGRCISFEVHTGGREEARGGNMVQFHPHQVKAPPFQAYGVEAWTVGRGQPVPRGPPWVLETGSVALWTDSRQEVFSAYIYWKGRQKLKHGHEEVRTEHDMPLAQF